MVDRIKALLAGSGRANELVDRIAFLLPGKHFVDATGFTSVTTALARRKKLQIRYFNGPGETPGAAETQRASSRCAENWYLDAWCPQAQTLRRFTLHEMESAVCMDEASLEVSLQDLNAL